MGDVSEDEMREPGLADRARAIAERANRLLADAEEATRAGEELSDIEDRLAALEEEQRRLDEEFVTVGAGRSSGEVNPPSKGSAGATEPPRRGQRGLADWVEGLTGAISENLNETIRSHVGHLGGIGASVASAVSGMVGDSTRHLVDVLERSVDVEAGPAVTVDNFAGPVSVGVGPPGVVKVRAEIYGPPGDDGDSVHLFVDHDAGRVFVRCQSSYSVPGRRHAKLFLTVPEGSQLEVRTQGGQISVDGVGGPATLRTAGGSVTVQGATGDVDAATAGGSLTIEAQRGGRVRAVTMGGQVSLRGSGYGPVEAQTSGGSIRIDGADGSVRAHTAGGSVTVSGRVVGDWSLRTAGGSVTAVVGPDTNAAVDASGGSASTDFPQLSVERRHVRGLIGDGSEGTITMRSLGGRVAILRAPTGP
ncbi:MAG TPA: DUF4097 family beta strand repeat-containing protein [Acidimicrobiales bacterium]|nr:DUF4097 family beta strand repeat-containing protein [Acidimicrobiales bacterium]